MRSCTGATFPLLQHGMGSYCKSMRHIGIEDLPPTMTQLLIQYSYLQLLDLLTTMAFLLQGVREGNPLVRFAIETAPSPVSGLFAVKAMALLLGCYCWRTRKAALLGKVNVLFAALIAWNLLALILGSVFPHRLG